MFSYWNEIISGSVNANDLYNILNINLDSIVTNMEAQWTLPIWPPHIRFLNYQNMNIWTFLSKTAKFTEHRFENPASYVASTPSGRHGVTNAHKQAFWINN